MSVYLLDVNVLIALIDSAHIHHDRAHHWFSQTGSTAWATCPLTENGLVRIVGSPRYANSMGTPAAVMPILQQLRQHTGHQFWPDVLSIADMQAFNHSRLLQHGQITDSYLLALAQHYGGQLATFDHRLCVDGVHCGVSALHLI